MKINIHNLRESETDLLFEVSAKDLEVENINFISDIRVNVKVLKTGSQIDLKIKISGEYQNECDRCLEMRTFRLNNDFEIVYKFDLRNSESGFETDDDIKFIPPNTQVINIRNDVRDFVLLSVPMRNVPDEVNGACVSCGKKTDELIPKKDDIEINPVWEKLLKNK
ncbi:MAG: DUF177 domain-containing protein [Bacteroidetes bacterium]|nr:DUF177 domain-containing protein [Bacteroidota bacterium]